MGPSRPHKTQASGGADFSSFSAPTPGQGPTSAIPQTGPCKLLVKNGSGGGTGTKYTPQARVAAGPPRAKPTPPHPITNARFQNKKAVME